MSESELVYLLVGIAIGVASCGAFYIVLTAKAFANLWRDS